MNQINMSNQEHPKKLSLAGRMASLFVKNKELNILVMLFIVAWGIGSFILMPKNYNPDIVAPAFTITTAFPGATAQQVQELVTRPMEDAISELPDIDQLISHSFDGGQSVVMVQFKVGTPAENAKISLSQKFKDNMFQKPIGASDPSMITLDPDDVPIISIALTSDTRSPQALRNLAFDLADELKLVTGTSKVAVVGGLSNNLQIELNAEKLSAYHLAVSDVINTLNTSNGIYTAEPLKNNNDTETLRVNGSIASTEDAAHIVLIPSQDKPIALGDVAIITQGPGEITKNVHFTEKNSDPKNAAYVTIAKIKGANISSVTNAVREKLATAKKQGQFSSVNFSVLRDDGETAHDEIFTLTKHLILSIVIVVIILMAFLGIRNSLIVAISIPLTLLTSFGIGLLAGQTVNRITLFALILALGLLVDDAIVIIENVHRTIKNNPGGRKSTLIIQAVDEVGVGVFMSTITILLAFIPMAFVSGMMGPYMSPIPFFVSVTLLVSLFFAFTINPALTGMFSSHKAEEKENVFVKSIHKIENHYATLIGNLAKNKRKKNIVLISAGVLLFLSLLLPLFKIVQFRMLPKANKEQFYIYLNMPNGTTYTKTNEVSTELEKASLNSKEVTSVESFIGTAPISDFNGLFKGSFMRSQENQATLKINLTPHTQRSETSEQIALRLRDTLNQEVLTHVGDAKIIVVEDPPGPPVRSTFFLKVQGNDQQLLDSTAKDLAQISSSIAGIVDLNTSSSQRSIEKQYKVDIEKAGRIGVAPAVIIETLHAALSGINVARYQTTLANTDRQAEQQFVILRMKQSDRTDINDLSHITVKSTLGATVPISELLIEEPLAAQSELATDARQQVIYVSGEMGARSVMYAVFDLFPKLFGYHLNDGTGHITSWSPLGVTYTNAVGQSVDVRIDGEWKLTLEIFRDLGTAMAVALLLIYFVLVIQIRSVVVPLLIMATIPLALIGVLVGFAVLGATKGTYFNATSMIGVIALSGIVVKNAIIYLAYLDELKERKLPLTDALMEAGRVRLLPILLTSLTAILGSLTIIADPVWEGLAWAIIFGLSVSTILTLIIFPLLYQTFEGKKWD
ncbi:MAG: AcrB/AcrD/AcrF family protein [Candidatus Moranbacteria bacterium GW2011_GWE1_35_17]|nr:MAG: AcrB/AcrD/AcrF family protein [Candidatus Moranbacteria bacterium GW2011_GWE1_35_17]KKP73844.1 MAG: AcrB/AcrD/AcrF family protein [Candidatus Moranbacteria bacterium GW2011_GWE2_35_164]KKP85126.1 MAG: AcrB/AcrD/AcrF family protein [Candidatus Moranbacteria bacterium GW2011_GWF2_35_54]